MRSLAGERKRMLLVNGGKVPTFKTVSGGKLRCSLCGKKMGKSQVETHRRTCPNTASGGYHNVVKNKKALICSVAGDYIVVDIAAGIDIDHEGLMIEEFKKINQNFLYCGSVEIVLEEIKLEAVSSYRKADLISAVELILKERGFEVKVR